MSSSDVWEYLTDFWSELDETDTRHYYIIRERDCETRLFCLQRVMGNSASNAQTRTIRESSPVPTAGNPHSSLGAKKKSLELPDLASLSLPQNTRGRQPKTASIPIPTSPPSPFSHYLQPQRAPRYLSSTTDVDLSVPPQQNLPPFPPPPRPNPSAPRGRQQPISPRQQQQQVARMQELYNQSQQPALSPQRPFQQETVRSSIPVALTKALPNVTQPAQEIVQQQHPEKEDPLADLVPVKIVWNGGGAQVVLARAGDDEWKGRQLMEKELVFLSLFLSVLTSFTDHPMYGP